VDVWAHAGMTAEHNTINVSKHLFIVFPPWMPSKLMIIAESIPIVRNLLTNKIVLAGGAFRPPRQLLKNQRLSA
jgi:hypothetical protein